MSAPDWIAVDWGTSTLRAWAMDGSGAVLDAARSGEGMGTLPPGQAGFEPALLRLVESWLAPDRTIQVVACGMGGARQGWREAPYRPVPAAPLAEGALTLMPSRDPRIRVHVAGGVSQSNPPDVMRGEETQIAGLLAAVPGFDGVVALPGTHTKWVQIVDGEIFHFASFMTGELYALLAEKSVLRHSLDPDGFARAPFVTALNETLSRPERVAGWLFGLRAAHLLQGAEPVAAASRLSGYLLGMELAASRPYWLGQRIALVAAGRHAERYAAALDEVGASHEIFDPDTCVLAGLSAARATLIATEGTA